MNFKIDSSHINNRTATKKNIYIHIMKIEIIVVIDIYEQYKYRILGYKHRGKQCRNMMISPFLKIHINPEALVTITRCIDYSPKMLEAISFVVIGVN